jgi:phage tail sheath gpL-like
MSGNVTETITFNEVPYSWLVPGTYVEVRPNYTNIGVFDYPAKVLIIGQMLGTGTATPNQPYLGSSFEQATALFGAGSQAADMLGAFLKANPYTPVDIIGVPDPSGGTAATFTITASGAPNAAGTLALYVAGNFIPVGVGATDTIATIMANIVAAVNAIPTLQVTAALGTGGTTVVLTSKHLAAIGYWLLPFFNLNRGDAFPQGLSLAAAITTPGTGTISLATALANVSNTWYTDLLTFTFDGTVTAELERRYNAMVKLDMHAYWCFAGSYGQAVSEMTGSGIPNSRFRSTIPVLYAPQPPWMWGAALAGVCSSRLTNDPARQLRGVVLPGIIAPADANCFNLAEREILLSLGFSTWNKSADGSVVLERVVTENKFDQNGVATTAWQDIMCPKVMSRIRYDWITYVSLQYPDNKLSDDGSLATEYDPTVVTPKRMKGSWAARSQLYEQNGWIEESAASAQASVFVRDPNDRNRMNARQEVQRIGNLMVLAGALEFQV